MSARRRSRVTAIAVAGLVGILALGELLIRQDHLMRIQVTMIVSPPASTLVTWLQLLGWLAFAALVICASASFLVLVSGRRPECTCPWCKPTPTTGA
jgi:hypothetical protein